MSLYAIGDLHLSLNSNKSMDVFGGAWENYISKIQDGFSDIRSDDVTVLCGDLTWSSTLKDSVEDFAFIERLPGRKIIVKGNHDYWWTTVTSAKKFFQQNGIKTIDILHNNCYTYGDIAICGTRGWLYAESEDSEQDRKILAREAARLETSLKAAGAREKLCFIHYPPRYNGYVCEHIVQVLEAYGVKQCYYGHIHSHGHKWAVQGKVGSVEYKMISADYLKFKPLKVL